ncbi:hypothetical protein [Sulfurimonas marina]|uniref:Uncharacterized protein n=1 Tax=Sulfurimonas marina TaxID=2590551 RepID=A0A7M1AUT9_9BACT|nr:hypothetical protein [Sulfurimonas marina]QOP41197.1 hypothetical protein FJR03_05350 [Sulfurimonas marina]
MTNIEIFRALSGLVFAKAYNSFPLKVSINPSELALQLGDKYWEESQHQISKSQFEYIRERSPAGLAKPTIQWLIDAGFLDYERFEDNKFIGICLTAKGLESIESNESGGERLLNALTDLAKDELKDQARSQLSKVFSEALSWSISNAPTIISNLSRMSAN